MGKRTSKARRQFLKGALIGGGAAAIAVASGGAVAAPRSEKRAPQPNPQSQGYQVTPHVLEYYKTAQF
jgi:nitrous oxide reductase